MYCSRKRETQEARRSCGANIKKSLKVSWMRFYHPINIDKKCRFKLKPPDVFHLKHSNVKIFTNQVTILTSDNRPALIFHNL